MARLVVPTGAQATDQAYPHRPETWQQLADEAGVTIAVLGDQWCTDNFVSGLGIASEYVAPPDPPTPSPQLVDVLYNALQAIEAPTSAADVAAALADAIAPLVGGV